MTGGNTDHYTTADLRGANFEELYAGSCQRTRATGAPGALGLDLGLSSGRPTGPRGTPGALDIEPGAPRAGRRGSGCAGGPGGPAWGLHGPAGGAAGAPAALGVEPGIPAGRPAARPLHHTARITRRARTLHHSGAAGHADLHRRCAENSAAGNRARVFRVTGGNTDHYTTADLRGANFDELCAGGLSAH